MKIQLDETYRLETDAYNYTLLEHKISQKKNAKKTEYYDPLAYYDSIINLSRGILNHEVKKSTVDDINKVCQVLEDCATRICNSIEKVLEEEKKK